MRTKSIFKRIAISLTVIMLVLSMFPLAQLSVSASDTERNSVEKDKIALDLSPGSGDLITGVEKQMNLTISISNVNEALSYENVSLVIRIPKPLQLVDEAAFNHSLVQSYELDDSDEDALLVTLDLCDITPDLLGEWASEMGDNAGTLPSIGFRVVFPNLTTEDGAVSEITAQLWQDGEDLSQGDEAVVPEVSSTLTAAAGSDWLLEKQLVTDSSAKNLLGDEHKYTLAKNESNIGAVVYYLVSLKNNKAGKDTGVVATDLLEFADQFELPAPFTPANSTVSFSVQGNGFVIQNYTSQAEFDAADTRVASGKTVVHLYVSSDASGYNVQGKAYKNTDKDDLDSISLVMELDLNATYDGAVFDAGYLKSFTNEIEGQFTTVIEGATPESIANDSVKAWIGYNDHGVTPPGEDGSITSISKKITDSTALTFITGATEPQFKTFTLSGFGNKNTNELTNFTIDDVFNSAEMYPTTISLAGFVNTEYSGYQAGKQVKITFTAGKQKVVVYADPGDLLDLTTLTETKSIYKNISGITADFGTVAVGGLSSASIDVTFAVLPVTAPKTINNVATVQNSAGKMSASASFYAKYKEQPFMLNKVAYNPSRGHLETDVFLPGEDVYYTLYIHNQSQNDYTNFKVTDVMQKGAFEEFELVGIAFGKGQLSAENCAGTESFPSGYVLLATDGTTISEATLVGPTSIDTATVSGKSFGGSVSYVRPNLSAEEPSSSWDFASTLPAGYTILVRYKVKVSQNIAADVGSIRNDFYVKFNDGIGDGLNAETPPYGTTIIPRENNEIELSILKLADKLAYDQDVSHGAAADNSYFDAFDSSALEDKYLPSKNEALDSAPMYVGGEKVNFTIFVKNTGGRPAEVLNIYDLLQKHSGTVDLRSYFEKDASSGLLIEDLKIAFFDKDGNELASQSYDTLSDLAASGDVLNAAAALQSSNANLLMHILINTTDPESAFYLKNGSGDAAQIGFGDGYQLQIQYSLTTTAAGAKGLSKGILTLRNTSSISVIEAATAKNLTFRYKLASPYRNGRSYTTQANDNGVGDGAKLLNYVVFNIANPEQQVGITKTVSSSTKKLQVFATNSIDKVFLADNDSLDAKYGAVFSYKISVLNRTQKVISGEELQIYDYLPEGQVPTDKLGNEVTDGNVYNSSGVVVGTFTRKAVGSQVLLSIRLSESIQLKPSQENSFYVYAVIKDYEVTEKALLSDSKYHTQFIPRSVANNATIEVSNLQQQGIVDAKAYNAYLDSQSASAGQFVNANVTKATGKTTGNAFLNVQAGMDYYRDTIAPGIKKEMQGTNGQNVTPGSFLSFTVTVTNTKDKKLTDFTVTDLLDDRMNPTTQSIVVKYNGVDITEKVTQKITLSTAGSGSYHTMSWKIPKEYPVGKTDKLTITYTAIAGKTQGYFKNHAFLTATQPFHATLTNGGVYVNKENVESIFVGESAVLKNKVNGLLGSSVNSYGRLLWDEQYVNIVPTSGLVLQKGVRKAGTSGGFSIGNGKSYIYQDVGEKVEYQLVIKNIGGAAYAVGDILDMLPKIGDTGVVLTNDARSTEFEVSFDEQPNIKIYDVPVSKISANGLFASTDATKVSTATVLYTAAQTSAEGWSAQSSTPSKNDNAVLVKMNGYSLQTNRALVISFEAVVHPKTDADGNETIQISTNKNSVKAIDKLFAWNSFGAAIGSYTIEPLKVGVQTSLGKITITKELSGSGSEPLSGYEFSLYDPANPGTALAKTTTEQDGSAYFANLEPGKTYLIRETNTRETTFQSWTVGGTTTKDKTLTVTIPTSTNPEVKITATNRQYEEEPDEETPDPPVVPPVVLPVVPPKYPDPPTEPIDPSEIDPENPPRFNDRIPDEYVPEGWDQEQRVDEENVNYWTIFDMATPLGFAGGTSPLPLFLVGFSSIAAGLGLKLAQKKQIKKKKA